MQGLTGSGPHALQGGCQERSGGRMMFHKLRSLLPCIGFRRLHCRMCLLLQCSEQTVLQPFALLLVSGCRAACWRCCCSEGLLVPTSRADRGSFQQHRAEHGFGRLPLLRGDFLVVKVAQLGHTGHKIGAQCLRRARGAQRTVLHGQLLDLPAKHESNEFHLPYIPMR